ncbi:MAG: hypothetical protein WA687_13160, partial [Solirubrobacterales bacterium]
ESGGGSGSDASGLDEEQSEGAAGAPVSPPDGGGPGGDGGESGGASPGKGEPSFPGLRLFAFRPDIRFGVAGSGNLATYEQLSLGRALPDKNPVIAFVGVSDDGERVAFDISGEVAMVRGPGHCIGGSQSCSLLTLRTGQAVDILTGKPGRTFRLDLVGIEFVEVKPPKGAGASVAGRGRDFDLAQGFIGRHR